MRFMVVLLFICFCGGSPQKYISKYDHINVELLLKNDRLLKNYIDCFLDKQKCTPLGMEIKKNIPEALKNGCARCSDDQKTAFKRIIRHLAKNRRDWLNELTDRYDPNEEFQKRYHYLFAITN
ncbi:ejaculatory bulb-specific protein 3 [Aethina tumida]|uniref:ejaculatory bulb-specific protein 3 n=1 Tax=Aethina tumida TaxID=116153 RepID=UPI00214850EA|nr:ejaculatory bulb-specific protein 3 [Aethina tumida]